MADDQSRQLAANQILGLSIALGLLRDGMEVNIPPDALDEKHTERLEELSADLHDVGAGLAELALEIKAP